MATARAAGHTWRELEDQCVEFAKVVDGALQRVVDRAVTRLSRGLTAAGESPDDVGGVPGDWASEVMQTLSPYILATYESGALELAHNLVTNLQLEPGQGIPGVSNDLAGQYLSERQNLLRGVGDDLYRQMSASLVEGMNRGESTEELAERVKSIGGFTQGRANAVARTEVLTASNRGSYEQALLVMNDDEGKEWLATEDGRTRLDHTEADHQVVPLNANFTVGGWQMAHPGDSTAPAGEVVNCRCTIAYVFDNEMPPKNTCNGLGAVTAAVMNTGTCIVPPELHSSDTEVPPMTPAQERALYDDFKSRGAISPAYGGARIYKHLQDMQDQSLDEFQRLKVVDKVYAQDGGKSSFTEKFEEWSESAVGKKTTGGLEKPTYSKSIPAPLPRAPEPLAVVEPTASTTLPIKTFSKSQAGRDEWLASDNIAARSATLWADTFEGMRAVRQALTNVVEGRDPLTNVVLDGPQLSGLTKKKRGKESYTQEDLASDIVHAAQWIREEQLTSSLSGDIFRGMRVEPTATLHAGERVSGQAVSWTSSASIASRYANDPSGPNGEYNQRMSWKPVMVLGAGFHGADVGAHVVGRLAGEQPETVTSDDFIIESVEEYDPAKHGHLFSSYTTDNIPLVVRVKPVAS